MVKSQDVERMLTANINNFFIINKIKGLAYRQKQVKFNKQIIDILVDFADPLTRNLAIEVKTTDRDKSTVPCHINNLYTGKQFIEQQKFLSQTGRKGLLFINIIEEKKKYYFFIDVITIKKLKNLGEPISVKILRTYPEIKEIKLIDNELQFDSICTMLVNKIKIKAE